jgi:superfamily II DNA or RNA helicase
MDPDRRRFSGKEHIDLYVKAQGRCAMCGEELRPGWHADHVMPYSLGGPTEEDNGQALCPECNIKKGSGDIMENVRPWVYPKPLRHWQDSAARHVLAGQYGGGTDFLCVATPGAGKTVFALRVAYQLLTSGIADRVAVVCPTDHLTGQWRDKAHEVGIELQGDFRNPDGREAQDYQGVCLTYQQVASDPRPHRLNCQWKRTLAILDEIHHAGDQLQWGDKIRYAFENARYRLAISGTPFRTDRCAIPFVTYETDGHGVRHSKPDYSYSYADALGDKVCRPVLFPSFEGHMEWFWKGQERAAEFKDELPQDEARRRLRTALDLEGEWLPSIIEKADHQLTEIRDSGHRNAAGLIFAIDQDHARGIAQIVRRVTGIDPVVTISDDKDASDKIGQFALSTDRWIVAVKMISEGVDIPRLRVGIYATNVISELFFRQAVGRFMRFTPGIEEQSAYLYIPADAQLVEYATAIMEERDHQLMEEMRFQDRSLQEWIDSRMEREERAYLFEPASSSQAMADDVVFLGESYTGAEIAAAHDVREAAGIAFGMITDVLVARILKAADAMPKIIGPQQDMAHTPEQSLEQRKDNLRKIARRLVTKYRQALLDNGACEEEADYREINRELNKAIGIPAIKDATEDQLKKRVSLLQEWTERERSR